MALSEIYVDPSIAADSGAGTVGDPYGDLEFAIVQATFDLTNGTRVNIKTGTDELLAVNIATAMADTSVSAAWAPTLLKPCIFQGYLAAAMDRGIGGIDAGGTITIYDNVVLNGVWFVDMHLHNAGVAPWGIRMNDHGGLLYCEVNNMTGAAGGIDADNGIIVDSCYIHDVANIGVNAPNRGGQVLNCHLIDGPTNNFSTAIVGVSSAHISRNIIEIHSVSAKAVVLGSTSSVINNSIYSSVASTVAAISAVASDLIGIIANNLIEGFSGVGGQAIDVGQTNTGITMIRGNAVFNNTTDYGTTFIGPTLDIDNESLAASPFTDAANGDFAPVDTGAVKEGSLPQIIGGGLV